ncbi:histidine kinase [Pseudomonas sp. zfem002]|uniref:histidine kinase n=1 Tax=Pseudomonas sp. zfem002 TaxID=3078197 RepID=UPI002934BB6F|nr:histidine kinase [Pseudomonas sp. zfem002]
MPKDLPDMSALQDFLGDAHQLLNRAQECLQHFRLIGEDADASHCLIDTLATLRDRAQAQEQVQIADFCRQLCSVLDTIERRKHLHGPALVILEASICLLAWQLELVDPYDGTLNLDAEEENELLGSLESTLQAAAQTHEQSA